MYSLTTSEITEGQQADATPKNLFKRNAVIDQGLEIKLINTTCVCKDGWLVISKPLQVCAVKWYHHYLQHSGHTCHKEAMNPTMYWKGMRTTIRSITMSCRTCQTNKRWKLKYGPLLPKIGVVMITSTTSYFWFLVTFCHNRICGLAVAFKNYFLGCLPALLKIIPKRGVSRELRPNANNVIRPPPPNPPLHAMIRHVFIPLWQIRRCSCTGATLVRAAASPDFCLGFIFS
jgi:hypothetical protein